MKRKLVIDSSDEIQQRINKYLETRASKQKAEQEEHQRLIMLVKDAHDRGLSVREIAPLIGNIHPATVHRWLKEARELKRKTDE